MPFFAIEVPPGVVKADSPDASRGRWIDMDHVRFVRNLPEKVGGTHRWIEDGVWPYPARAAKAWGSYTGVQILAFGTAQSFWIYRETVLTNQTPYRIGSEAIALVNPFSTTNGSPIVTVADANHGITDTGTLVNFSGASAVGGITVNGLYTVTSIIGVNSFTITHGSNASSTAGPGGGAAVIASYTLNMGDVDTDYLVGWGIGTWGDSGWGEAQSLASALISDPTNWSMDVYGEDLVINQIEDGIWYYDTSANSRPARLANSPAQNRFVFVTPERYVFALGVTTLGALYDPMTVRWPDIEDPTAWTPSDTNTSNERKLQGGTRLMAGVGLADGISLVWSDTSLFLFQFTGSTAIYSSRMVSTDCGLIGPHAFCSANGAAFWMSESTFWVFNGFAQPIPNVEDIRRWVFSQIEPTSVMKSFAFFNPVFNEVWFVFTANGSSEPNLYVAVDLDNFTWIHGTWDRTCATLYTTREARPILFGMDGSAGRAWMHEFGDYYDDDTEALPCFIELAPTDIENGNVTQDVWGFIPDMQRQTGTFTLTLTGKDHPRGADDSEDILTFGPTDKLLDARCAGRQVTVRIEAEDLGTDFRMGRWGLEVQGAGRKRGSQ